MVARGNAEAGVAVDDAGRARRHGDIGEQRDDESGAHGRPVDRRHDHLRAIDHVEDEIPRFEHHLRPRRLVLDERLEQLEAASRGEGLPRTAQQRDVCLGIAVDRAPHVRELPVHRGIDGVQPGRVERDAQHPGRGPVEGEVGEGGVEVGHRASLLTSPG